MTSHAHLSPAHLLTMLHRLLEHLYALDLPFQAQAGKLNGVIDAGLAPEDSPSQHSALALDAEAVVNGIQERPLHAARL